jgi:hypothetical protein
MAGRLRAAIAGLLLPAGGGDAADPVPWRLRLRRVRRPRGGGGGGVGGGDGRGGGGGGRDSAGGDGVCMAWEQIRSYAMTSTPKTD